MVDRVYAYEAMEKSLADLSQRFALDLMLNLSHIKAKGSFRTDRHPAAEVLSPETIGMINGSQKDVFDLMRYPMIKLEGHAST